MTRLKQIASFFWDIPIERSSSDQNEYLEVVWSNGKKMLNSRNANYSFGNGYKVFEFAFKSIKDQLPGIQHVLVLGFGCGSVEHLLKKNAVDCHITGVEYDAEIVRLYNKHFAIDNNVNLLTEDAVDFLQRNNDTFDLIIVDLFNDLETSPLIFQEEFTEQLLKACVPGTKLIYNTVKDSRSQAQRTDLALRLSTQFKAVEFVPFQQINEIIIAK